jgi:hypothetical protein
VLTANLGDDIGRPNLVDPGARFDPFEAPVPVPEFNVRAQHRALRRLEQQGKKKEAAESLDVILRRIYRDRHGLSFFSLIFN